jgi:hypothetical protein
MTKGRLALLGLVVGSTLLLGGCKRLFGIGDCSKPQAYATAEEKPALRVPVGLDGLDTRAALRIPQLLEPEVPRGPKDPCLDQPPDVAAPGAPSR